MEINSIYNENCIATLERMEDENGFDFIITSPPYNTNVKANAKNNTLTVNVKENQYTYARYDGYDDSRVYDPFMGTGTTAVACKKMGIDYIGSELSQNQVQYALKRIKEECCQLSLF